MFGSKSFRGLTNAQSDIIQYWLSICPEGRLPARSQIDPGALRAHLSAISMIQVEQDGALRFRLVGSDLRTVLGQDVSGSRLGDLTGASVDMLSLGLAAAIDRQAPVGGVIERSRDRQAWLRLPFAGGAEGGLIILCHDVLVRHKKSHRNEGVSTGLSAPGRGLAA